MPAPKATHVERRTELLRTAARIFTSPLLAP
jgi:hypothetical protein